MSIHQLPVKIAYAIFAIGGLVVWKLFSISYMFGFDYRIYHQAAQLALQGVDPYVPYGIRLDVGTSYLYHPAFLLLIAPLTPLAPLLAALVWTAISLSLLYATWRMLIRRSTLDARHRFFLLAMLLVSAGLAESLWMGQVNVLVVFLLTFSFFNADSRPRLAGLALAVAVVAKTSPVIFILYFLAGRRWQAALWSAAGIAALTAAAVLIFGAPVLTQFLNVGLDLSGGGAAGSGLSLAVTLSDLGLGYGLAVWIQRGLAGALIAAALFSVYRGRARQVAFAAMLTGMVIASPLLWGHHAVLAFSALVIAAQYRWSWVMAALALFQLEFISQLSRWPEGLFFNIGWLIFASGLLYELWTRHLAPPQPEITPLPAAADS